LGAKVAALVWLNEPVSAKLLTRPLAVLPLLIGPLSSASIRAKVQPKRNVVLAAQFRSAALTSRRDRMVRRAVGLRPVVR
jgi:hypothetical protein